MPDQTVSALRDAWEIIKLIGVAFVGMLGWNMKRYVAKVDDIEKDYIDKETFNDTLNAIRTDIKESRKEVNDGMKESREEVTKAMNRIHDRIDRIGTNTPEQ